MLNYKFVHTLENAAIDIWTNDGDDARAILSEIVSNTIHWRLEDEVDSEFFASMYPAL